jgi:hypothetical protein
MISFASLRSRSSGILNVLTTYVSGVLLRRALAYSLLATAHCLPMKKAKKGVAEY